MKDFFRQNGILILIAAILAAVITFVVTSTLGGIADPMSNFFQWVSTPVRSVVSTFADWTEERYSRTYEREALEAEIERLRQEIAELEEKAREGEAASRENEDLRSLLGLAEKRKDLTYEMATVTARGTSSWSSTFTISKGSNGAIAVDACVVDQYGNLVGLVAEVGSNWATVRTIVDAEIQMGGILARTDGAAVLEGDFALMGQGRLKLTYLPEGVELLAGDQVLTLSREGIYPSGLVVGHVEEIHAEASGMGQYAVVAPEADLDSLNRVFIITDFDIVE